VDSVLIIVWLLTGRCMFSCHYFIGQCLYNICVDLVAKLKKTKDELSHKHCHESDDDERHGTDNESGDSD
jgi:hypothetical protein